MTEIPSEESELRNKLRMFVAAGVELLDNHRPDWRQEVNSDQLDVFDADTCILGQVFGDFGEGLTQLDLSILSIEVFRHGFNSINEKENTILNELWREEINGTSVSG